MIVPTTTENILSQTPLVAHNPMLYLAIAFAIVIAISSVIFFFLRAVWVLSRDTKPSLRGQLLLAGLSLTIGFSLLLLMIYSA